MPRDLTPLMARVLDEMVDHDGIGIVRRGVRHNATRNAMTALERRRYVVEIGHANESTTYQVTPAGRTAAAERRAAHAS